MELCIKLVKLHNELVHLQLPQLAEKRLSVSQALRQAFEEYSGQLAPGGSDSVLGQLSEAQLLRICQDAGCMEPQGSLSQSGLKNVLAAFRPQAYEGPLAVSENNCQ
ncbi:hypothetical protein HaLaN_01859 [Haematococcus lacustris]|uniref:Uncharacterized protein n=1 Tax=Haematococcus lacustris TaxID=44745 RepID=A0A699YJQ2_HAELA|nr:hypothetical protein HaLaN_01859 [Haematococcus lacustris]